jgi:hypothetical protein
VAGLLHDAAADAMVNGELCAMARRLLSLGAVGAPFSYLKFPSRFLSKIENCFWHKERTRKQTKFIPTNKK